MHHFHRYYQLWPGLSARENGNYKKLHFILFCLTFYKFHMVTFEEEKKLCNETFFLLFCYIYVILFYNYFQYWAVRHFF